MKECVRNRAGFVIVNACYPGMRPIYPRRVVLCVEAPGCVGYLCRCFVICWTVSAKIGRHEADPRCQRNAPPSFYIFIHSSPTFTVYDWERYGAGCTLMLNCRCFVLFPCMGHLTAFTRREGRGRDGDKGGKFFFSMSCRYSLFLFLAVCFTLVSCEYYFLDCFFFKSRK